MNRSSLRAFALLFALGAALIGCARKDDRRIELPANHILVAQVSWCTVKAAYAGIKSHPTLDGIDLARLRKGEIVEILGKAYGQDGKKEGPDLWYRVKFEKIEGWVNSGGVEVFDSREKAEISSREEK